MFTPLHRFSFEAAAGGISTPVHRSTLDSASFRSSSIVLWCRSRSMYSVNPCGVVRSTANTGTVITARGTELLQSRKDFFSARVGKSLISLSFTSYSPMKSSASSSSLFGDRMQRSQVCRRRSHFLILCQNSVNHGRNRYS
jgi:hypothetical protein